MFRVVDRAVPVRRRRTGSSFSIRNSPFAIRRAFTLVEMLLALALTAVLFTLTGRVVVQTLQAQTFLEQDGSRSRRVDLVFDRLSTDLERWLPGLPGETAPLTVFGTPQQVLQFSTLAASAEEPGSLHVALRPATVRYRLSENSNADGSSSLVREVVDRTNAAALPLRETLAEQLVEFKVEVFSRGAWVNGFAPTESNTPPPSAVRVSLRWVDAPQPQSRIFRVPDVR